MMRGLWLRVRQSLAAAEQRNEPGARDLSRWVTGCWAPPVIVPVAPSDAVTVTREGLTRWARRWPCADFPDAPVTFGYSGVDLCDIAGRGWQDCDSDGVGPLADDARELRDLIRALRNLPGRMLARRCACGLTFVGDVEDVDEHGAEHEPAEHGHGWAMEHVHSGAQCVEVRQRDGACRVCNRNPEGGPHVGTFEWVEAVPDWARGYLDTPPAVAE